MRVEDDEAQALGLILALDLHDPMLKELNGRLTEVAPQISEIGQGLVEHLVKAWAMLNRAEHGEHVCLDTGVDAHQQRQQRSVR